MGSLEDQLDNQLNQQTVCFARPGDLLDWLKNPYLIPEISENIKTKYAFAM